MVMCIRGIVQNTLKVDKKPNVPGSYNIDKGNTALSFSFVVSSANGCTCGFPFLHKRLHRGRLHIYIKSALVITIGVCLAAL